MSEPQNRPEAEDALPPKKRRSILRFLSILFAAAFLLVALSLAVKIHSMQKDIDMLNSGARENIVSIENELAEATRENETLHESLDSAVRSAKASEMLALAQNALLKEDQISFQGYMAELEGYADALSPEAATIYNELLSKLPKSVTR